MFNLVLAIGLALFILSCFSLTRNHVVRWARVLWVCRAGATSAILGLVLFWLASPARDLFAEVGSNLVYWGSFLVLVFLWALIVHFAGRKAVEQQAWVAAGATLPLEEGARKAAQARFACAGTWVPRLLGLLCFVAVIVGVQGSEMTLHKLLGDGPVSRVSFLTGATALLAIVYFVFVVVRRWGTISLATSMCGDPAGIAAEPDVFWFAKPSALKRRARRPGTDRPSSRRDVIAVLLVVATILCFAWAAIDPATVTDRLPRACFIPVMLGLPVFVLAILSALSHRIRFPVMLILAGVLAGAATLAPAFHMARSGPRPDGEPDRQLVLIDAYQQWKTLYCRNNTSPDCGTHPVILALAGGASRAAFFSATVVGDLIDSTDPSSGNPRNFSKQILAMSGVSGGSVGAAIIRAALEDAQDGKPPCQRADGLWFGAARTPSWNAFYGFTDRPETWKGCLQALTAGDFLSPAILGLVFRDGFAAPISLAKSWLGSWIDGFDRGTLLEIALERRYEALVKPDKTQTKSGVALDADKPWRGLDRTFGKRPDGVWMPLLLLNATSVDTGRRVIASEFQPTSIDCERLFPEAYDLFRELARTMPDQQGATPAVAKGSLPSGKAQPCAQNDTDPLGPAQDMRLSTAATLSARFPVISPYGGLRVGASSTMADRLVDGGYFENDGVTTAFELAQALIHLKLGIRPAIVHITNDPVGQYDHRHLNGAVSDFSRAPDMSAIRPSSVFESVLNPVTAIAGTRGGHAAEAVRRVLLAKDDMDYYRFQVFTQRPSTVSDHCSLSVLVDSGQKPAPFVDAVSMSWWLSSAVQTYLDYQLCHSDNNEEYNRLSQILGH